MADHTHQAARAQAQGKATNFLISSFPHRTLICRIRGKRRKTSVIMIIKRKDFLDAALKKNLQDNVYDIVGVIHKVYNALPNGMPEYIYQEALGIALEQSGIDTIKEYRHHPVFMDRTLESYLKMDFMVPRSQGNIIIECKAIDNLSNKEYQQLFSYMIGTGFPIGLIVNFHSMPLVTIHRFYYDKEDHTITSF